MSTPAALLTAFDIEENDLSTEPHKSSSQTRKVTSDGELPFEMENLSLPAGEEGNSEYMTCFLLLNSMIGSGILNQPQVFDLSGLAAAILMFTISAYFIWLGLNVLVECGISRGKLDYSELAIRGFGLSGERTVDISIIVANFGALMSYLDVIGGTASQLLMSWSSGCHDNDSGPCGPYLMTSLIIIVFVFPICLLKYFGHLAIFSVISMAAIGSILMLVIIAGPIVGPGGRIHSFGEGFGTQLGSIIFTLSCAFAAFPTYKSMKEPSIEKWRRVTTNTVVIGYFMCIGMGLGGYLSFTNSTDGLIVNNFSGHYADFFKILLIVHLVLYIPVEFIVMRQCLLKLVGISQLHSYTTHVSVTIALLFG